MYFLRLLLLCGAVALSWAAGRTLKKVPWIDSLNGKHSNDSPAKFQSLKELENKWQEFKLKHEKSYDDHAEEENRKKIFTDNLMEIDAHNELFAKGQTTYQMGMNQFGDLTHDEFVKVIACRKPRNASAVINKNARLLDKLVPATFSPRAVDWRSSGVVTRVKNQGYCGSCWTFAAVGALESQVYLKTRELVTLSEQNLVDCSVDYGGCRGGFSVWAYEYIIDNGGIDTEDSYQYEAENGRCRYDSKTRGAQIKSYGYLSFGTESILERVVAYLGPTAAAIDASYLQFYASGIYSSSRCSNSFYRLNHEVVVVGYKTSSPGRDYWIVKNSWGANWGMDGYILMSRNKNNQCGIASDISIPFL